MNFLSTLGQILLKIPQCDLNSKSYLPTVNTILKETVLSEDEFDEAFKMLKRNKYPGHDSLDVNIITSVYEFIEKKKHF